MARVSDTSDEAAAVQLAALRARSPEARFLEAVALSEMMHAAVMARLKARYPEKSVVELVLMTGDLRDDVLLWSPHCWTRSSRR